MNINKLSIYCIATLLCIACSSRKEEEQPSDAKLYFTEELKEILTLDTVTVQSLEDELLLNGRITFNRDQVSHVYPVFSGNITELKAQIGDYVTKEDILAVMKSAEVSEFHKQLKEAEAQLVVSQRNLEAVQDMYQAGMASEKDILEAKLDLSNAEGELNNLNEIATIYSFSGNSFYQIVAPVSGFIVEKSISKDMYVRSEQDDELFIISNLEDVWVMADVYESDISKVKQGEMVTIRTMAYPDIVFEGKIDKVYHILNEDSRTMSVRIRLPNKDYRLKPGMFASVSVKISSAGEEAVSIPSHALVFEYGKHFVVILNGKGYFEIRQVEILKQSKEVAFVKSGVKPGEILVNRNVLLVYNELITK